RRSIRGTVARYRRVTEGGHRQTTGTARASTIAPPSKPLGPYNPFVPAGDWIIVSAPVGTQEGAPVEGGAPAPPTKTIANLKDQLASVGASLSDVAKTLCFLTDMDTFDTFNESYIAGFGDHRPARSTVQVVAVPLKGGGVEIEAWAYKPQ